VKGKPAAKNIKPQQIVLVPEYSEGIVFDHAGNAYIPHGDTITKVTPDGQASPWAKTGEPNGHKILADGTDWRFLNEIKRELKG